MKRKIIKIDTEKCDGCGACVPDCPEGALQIIDGKARLISDLFCDGLGACINTCPRGAIAIEEREAEPYDERKVMKNIVAQGENTIKAHLKHLKDHHEMEYLKQAMAYLRENGIEIPDFHDSGSPRQGGGCPGAMMKDFRERAAGGEETAGGGEMASELRQWPVQLKLLNPAASYFTNADLLIVADCSPFAYADFHRRFVRGRIVIMFCPKLDPYIEEYVTKLAAIFSTHRIKSITTVQMEVPCCGGVGMIVKKALEKSGMKIPIQNYIISIQGEII
ncbi:MAG: 4Fe-4S binding protein [Candidatus Krumholzibacteriota bacterium]|nr:4Fe-4S binding protein [Candidatus Krumholzibacteriota bacterium]